MFSWLFRKKQDEKPVPDAQGKVIVIEYGSENELGPFLGGCGGAGGEGSSGTSTITYYSTESAVTCFTEGNGGGADTLKTN